MSQASVRVLAHHEDVHARKSIGMIGFEAMPLIQIGLIGRARKLFMKFFDHRRIVKGFEARKDKSLSFRNAAISGIVKRCSMTLNSRSRQPLML